MTGARACGPARDLPSAEFAGRVRRLLAWQARERLDALLVTSDVNRYYLTGIETSNGCFLAERGLEPVFYTDFRYLTMASNRLTFMPAKKIWRPSDEAAAFQSFGRKWRRVGYEGSMGAARFLKLREALPDVEWVDAAGELSAMRSVKSRAEQRVMRAAVAANDRAYSAVMRQVAPGMTEWEIRNIARREADLLGQGEAFDTIPCAGRNAAECHHHPDATPLRRGQPLLLDMGVSVDRYCSDMTRTVCLGAPSPALREVHRIVLEANRKAIRAIRPGRPCCEIDAVARAHIEKAGYGKHFGHGLGHSLGLEIHESPNFAATCSTPLKPGMVLTVEPGIYLAGRLGVRIEDVVLVTSGGCEVLSQSPRELTL
jgi:Xaa-Pro aminopeptidase